MAATSSRLGRPAGHPHPGRSLVTALQKSILRGVSESVQVASSQHAGVETTSPAEALANRYAGDPVLLALYKRKLSRRGWASHMDAVERAYVRWVRRRRQQ